MNVTEVRGKKAGTSLFDFATVTPVASGINGLYVVVSELPDVTLTGVVPTNIGSGRKTVTAAGTPEQLVSTPVDCQYVMVKAISTNSGTIVIGGSGVRASASTRKGFPLSVVSGSAESVTIPIDDVSKVYVDCTTSGEGVVYTYM